MSILHDLEANIRSEFPDYQMIYKDKSRFMRILNVLLLIVTFGQQKTFMTGFTTTIGSTVYAPARWDTFPEKARYTTLRHERVHMRQAKRYGLVWFSILYLLAPVPVLFAWWRTKFEMEAYEETVRVHYELYGTFAILNVDFKRHIIDHFTTGQYGWMWVRRSTIEKWFSKTLQKVVDGEVDVIH